MSTGGVLAGLTALVTGGTAGIGGACAEALLAAGVAALVVNGRNRERGEQGVADLRSRFPDATVLLAVGDMTVPGDAEAVMAQAVGALARVDVLVNATGGDDLPALLHETPLSAIPGIAQRCLVGHMLSCRAALPHMRARKAGAIINIASDAAKIPTPGESVIGAAMAGILMFTRGLALEAKHDGIRANVLTPSLISGTAHFDRIMADPFAGKLLRRAAQKAALGVVSKQELANLAVFLASPAAAKITGQAISMTGGISAQ
ncbi:MAG TPA: SDR family NAD(P)-dependent oxidoreductase [Casimicrobiaceae bacterium]|nr:SDR family NAD(P)-dependent oxidoreductase [Casimicrobiaceae bacterium]